MKLVLSAEARADLKSIGDWIARTDPARAKQVVAGIRRDCAELRSSHRQHRLADGFEAERLQRKLRPPYLIFFQVEEDVINVVHIIDGRRDYARLLRARRA